MTSIHSTPNTTADPTQTPPHRRVIGITYDGSEFCGWQRQAHSPNTVQAHVERALSKVAAHPIKIYCAGRTDAGVHALYQVCHFDTFAERDEKAWVLGANTQLPPSIALQWARVADPKFHARYTATARTYAYLIYRGRYRSSLWAKQSTWIHKMLDVDQMQTAAAYLIGEHDFSAFRAAGCQANHPMRRLERAHLSERGPFICFEITANAFLQHMVRNIVGSLIKVGRKETDPNWFKSVLLSKDRRQAGMTAPPQGLYFKGVRYPKAYELPSPDAYQGFLTWFL